MADIKLEVKRFDYLMIHILMALCILVNWWLFKIFTSRRIRPKQARLTIELQIMDTCPACLQ